MNTTHILIVLLIAAALASLVLAVLKVFAIITIVFNHRAAYEMMFLFKQALYSISLMALAWLAYKKICVLTGLDQGSGDV